MQRQLTSLPWRLQASTLLSMLLLLPWSGTASGQLAPSTRALDQCPLSRADNIRYRQLFKLQEEGEWEAADRLTKRIRNSVLLGWAEAHRYLQTDYTPDLEEMVRWLELNPRHPQAREIFQQVIEWSEGEIVEIPEPEKPQANLAAARPLYEKPFYRSDKTLSHSQYRRLNSLKRAIQRKLERAHLTDAGRLLQTREVNTLFDQFERDEAKSALASAWLYRTQSKRALTLAQEVATRSGERLPLAHWTAGLAAWRLGHFEQAVEHFERFAQAENLSPWNQASGAFWSARARFKLDNAIEAHRWLIKAAAHPRTFYGILAGEQLGTPLRASLAYPAVRCEDFAPLLATPGGSRALALVQIGLNEEAEQELLTLSQWEEPKVAMAMLALSRLAGRYHFGLRLAERLATTRRAEWSDAALDPFLYPTPAILPLNTLEVDRALLYAFIRQESSFDPGAGSHDGALGLMQLMPRTAAALHPAHTFDGEEQSLLYDPELNITLGQRYLRRLMRSERIESNLFRLIAAYNAGPGNLKKWDRLIGKQEDPLLFIEGLPSLETRLFLERVVANLWIYRAGLGQTSPSLGLLARGEWPDYQPLDNETAPNHSEIAAAR